MHIIIERYMELSIAIITDDVVTEGLQMALYFDNSFF